MTTGLKILPDLPTLLRQKSKFFLRVKRAENGCLLWQTSLTKWGHGIFNFGEEGQGYRIHAHRAAFAFRHGRFPIREVLRHTCNNASCQNADHIIEGTHEENRQDCVDAGRQAIGAQNGRAKLLEADAEYIIRQCLAGSAQVKVLAQRFGISKRAVTQIRDRKNWKSLWERIEAEAIAAWAVGSLATPWPGTVEGLDKPEVVRARQSPSNPKE
jgi:hypothetical protein